MNIALVTETYPPEVNGVAMTNQRLVRGLIELGHKVLLVKPRRSDAPDIESESLSLLEVFGLPIPNYPGLKIGIPAPGLLEHAFEDYQPDIIHIATEGPLGFSALRAAGKLGLPATSTFHTNFQDYCADYGAAWAGRVMMRYLKWFHNKCALTTVPDHNLIDRLEKSGVERLAYLGRGADTRLFDPKKRSQKLRASWGADENTPVAIYVGRAAAEKKIPLALESWQQARETCPELKMIVVGDGPVLKKLERKWPEAQFAGMRFDEDLAAHYASADIFVFGSESETFGNVVIEALASGLAVVTCDYAAGHQFIVHGENGYLSPLGDEEAFRQLVSEVVSTHLNLKTVRRAARASAEKYPWDQTIDHFSTLLDKASKLEQNLPSFDISSDLAKADY
ncbi:MAG: glycosyltransferase family 1 protein [Verrucomicrobiota bacterium]